MQPWIQPWDKKYGPYLTYLLVNVYLLDSQFAKHAPPQSENVAQIDNHSAPANKNV